MPISSMNIATNLEPLVQSQYLPYGRQLIGEDDIQAVVEVLRSDWLTTGPKVGEFESAFAELTGAKEAVAVSNGTAALHAAVYAGGIGPGDEVIVTPMTFAASANCVVYQGATPVFTDVNPSTLLIDPVQVEAKITPKTKAIIAVDYAGQPCDYDTLNEIARAHRLILIADACHSVGSTYQGRNVGALADLNTFSFHPVKHITTGEGGMITTQDPELARRMRTFRNHGITTDHRQREAHGSWFYEMMELGYNYRITDIQCALGISQLRKLPQWIQRRQEIAQTYNNVFADAALGIKPLAVDFRVSHAYHLYVVRVDEQLTGVTRDAMFAGLRQQGIGVNVHYVPVHLHPYYQENFGTYKGMLPAAETAFSQILTLPIFPAMQEEDVERVTSTVMKLVGR